MVRKIKKGLACALVAALAFTCAAPVTASAAGSATSAPEIKPIASATATVAKNVKAKVSVDKKGQVTIKEIKTNKKAKSISVASKVKVKGKTYKVTTIGGKAFAKASKATTVTLPKTITKINANAFSKSKIKIIKFAKGTKKVTISKKAFKGLKTKKMTIRYGNMSKANVKALKKALKAAGFKGTIKK